MAEQQHTDTRGTSQHVSALSLQSQHTILLAAAYVLPALPGWAPPPDRQTRRPYRCCPACIGQRSSLPRAKITAAARAQQHPALPAQGLLPRRAA
jgi:hypothetical protein